MLEALSGAINRKTDILITSGGLGPTPDDLTVEIVSKLLGVKPITHEGVIQDMMQRRNITDRSLIRPALIAMAKVPEGAKAYPNPVGVAPCIHAKKAGTEMFLLPGPPREVQGVFDAHIKPFIQQVSPYKIARVRLVVNVLEAEVGPVLAEVMKTHPGTYMKGAIAHAIRNGDQQLLPIDVVAKAENADAAGLKLSQALQQFEGLLYKIGKQIVSREA
jgi:molybdopterin-biosynthesis enzyme MoeA-like protein